MNKVNVPAQKTMEELKQEYWDAATGIPHATVERVMWGLPLDQEIENSERIRTLRQVWSKYHERMLYPA